MELVKDLLRQFWFHALALGVFIAAIYRYVQLARWEQNLIPFAVAAFGFVCVIASDEVADWTGRYGWTRQQWRRYPETVVRSLGGIALIVATVILFRR